MHSIHNLLKATATMINEWQIIENYNANIVFTCDQTHRPIGCCALFIALPFTPFIHYCFDLSALSTNQFEIWLKPKFWYWVTQPKFVSVMPTRKHTGTGNIGLAFIAIIAWYYSYSQISFIISVLRVVCAVFAPPPIWSTCWTNMVLITIGPFCHDCYI